MNGHHPNGNHNHNGVPAPSASLISTGGSTGGENSGCCFGNTSTSNNNSSNTNSNVCVAFRIWFTPDQERTKRELRQLSKKERENVWADLSANQKLSKYEINPEEPQFVKECLETLRVELHQHVEQNTNQSQSYQIAIQQNPSYVLNDSMLLRFLRADCFNPKQACQRILNHYEFKKDLFGQENGILGRDITYNDLSNDDKHVLGLGDFQALSIPDHANRRIMFFNVATLFKSLKHDPQCTATSVVSF